MTETQEIYDCKPKTVQEWALKYLVTNGLFAAQAEEVLGRFAESEPGKPMKGRWQDVYDGYPAPMLAVLKMGINLEAVKFIDEAIPKHFACAIFATKEPKDD